MAVATPGLIIVIRIKYTVASAVYKDNQGVADSIYSLEINFLG